MENEIPLGRRSPLYRCFEMLPALISFTMLGLVLVLPLFSARWAAFYVLAIVAIMFLRAVRSAFDVTRGYRRLRRSEQVDWNRRLRDLGDPRAALDAEAAGHSGMFAADRHRTHLRRIALDPARYPHPDQVLNAVIVAAYNESYDVIAPTIRALAGTHYDRARLAVFFAYEERGGMPMLSTARRLREEFGDAFAAFELVCHPRDLPGEIAGKGANISFAGRAVQEWAQQHGIDPSRVLITTLDCDNKPHANYFDCVTYHFIVHANRTRAAFQPVSLFLNNIWEAPAPTRVVASGNTFWNLISSVRPRSLRNFASHSQPLDALIEMDFWSRRTIVEDGHQYWRSYFHFRGDYTVVPIPTSISQDAVLADSYWATLVAQFTQLSRWSYGASDIPYVGVRVFGPKRPAPFWPSLGRLLSLLEGHITLASLAIIVAVGGWVPLLLASPRDRLDALVEQLPVLVGTTQQVAMLGLAVSVILAWRMLPPRPSRYGSTRNWGMLLQWVLLPFTIIIYSSATSLYSQGRLLVGSYRERFDVTVKSAVHADSPRRPASLEITEVL